MAIPLLQVRTFEEDVTAARVKLLSVCGEMPSAVLVAALADLIGQAAAVLDQQIGPMDLDIRLEEVIDRVRRRHHQIRRKQAEFFMKR